MSDITVARMILIGDNSMASIGTMIEQIDGMRDTSDLSEWENEFVQSIVYRYLASKKDTRNLTAKQVEIIECIWSKHFSG